MLSTLYSATSKEKTENKWKIIRLEMIGSNLTGTNDNITIHTKGALPHIYRDVTRKKRDNSRSPL